MAASAVPEFKTEQEVVAHFQRVRRVHIACRSGPSSSTAPPPPPPAGRRLLAAARYLRCSQPLHQCPHPPVLCLRLAQLLDEREQLTNASIERQQEVSEHDLVIRTLEPLEGGRKCFRLVGEVLVERTVAEVLPAVKKNRDNLAAVRRAGGEGRASGSSWGSSPAREGTRRGRRAGSGAVRPQAGRRQQHAGRRSSRRSH